MIECKMYDEAAMGGTYWEVILPNLMIGAAAASIIVALVLVVSTEFSLPKHERGSVIAITFMSVILALGIFLPMLGFAALIDLLLEGFLTPGC